MKKFTALILSVLMVVSMMPAMVFAGEDGTPNQPTAVTYDVSSPEALNNAISEVNKTEDNTSKITINLNANISLSGTKIDQINSFSGKFYGNNHSITGLEHSLFKSVNGASISNIIFNTPVAVTGPVLAETANNSVISGIRVSSTITGAKISAKGGIVGNATGTVISGCSNSVNVDDIAPTGGIAGTIFGGSIEQCVEGTLPTAGKLTGIVNAVSQNFKNTFTAENLTLTLTSSSVNQMILTDSSNFLSIIGGSIAKINTGSAAAIITLENTIVNDISATGRMTGSITLKVKDNALLKAITAGTIIIQENNGEIQKAVIGIGFSRETKTKLPTRIEKYGDALNNSVFNGANVTGPIGSNPYVYTAKYAAKIGNISYNTLADAFAAAKSGDTVTLIENIDISTPAPAVDYNKKIILDLNGYMINYPNNYMSISGTLTIKDSNYYSTGKFIGLPGGALKGKLIIQSGKYSFDPYTYLDVGSTRETASGGYYTVTRSISACNATVPNITYAFNGTAQKPTVTVTDTTGSKLTEGYHYTVGYANNINVGTATITIYGKNTYTGTKTITFTISQKAISAIKVDPIENQPYTGYQIRPSISLKDGTYALREGVDYTATYGTNTTLGSTGTVMLTGKGNYSGTTTLSFKISKDISTCTFSNIPDMDYTGYQLKPSVIINDGSLSLKQYSDYKVTYGTNVEAGTGSVVITGTGNYGGTKTLYFNIKSREQGITTRWNKYSKTLASAKFNLGATAQGNAKLSYSSLDPSVATVDATGNVTVVDTGIAKILIKAAKTGAYPETEKYVTVTVKPSKPVIKVTSTAQGKIRVQITKAPGVGRYQISYGRNGKYYNKYMDYFDTSSLTQTKYIEKLKSGQKYFVKVRAYKKTSNGTVWGTWTKVKVIKVG